MIVYQYANSLEPYNYNAFIYESAEQFYHFHRNFELIRVLDGSLEVTCDGAVCRMEKEDCMLILPNQLHSFIGQEKGRVWVGVFSQDFVPAFAEKIRGRMRTEPVFRLNREEDAYLCRRLYLHTDRIEDYAEEKGIGALCTMQACLLTACAAYLRDAVLTDRVSEPENDIAHRVIGYIERNFRQNISLRQLSEELGYEYHYFSRLFSRTFRVNFKTLLNQYRLDYAERLLKNGEWDMARVAMESGFGSIRTFNRVYAEAAHHPPKKRSFE